MFLNVINVKFYPLFKHKSVSLLFSIQHLSYCCGQVVNICNSDSLDDSLSIYPERFLTQLTSSLRRYLESTNFSSQRYILDAIVLGTLSIANLPEEKVAAAPIASSQLNNALFAMNLISSLQDFQSSGKDVIIKAVLDSICIICLATKTGSNEVRVYPTLARIRIRIPNFSA